MANLTRLSVLIGDADADRNRELTQLLIDLGVRHVVQMHAPEPLLEALKRQAFDVLICAERLGDSDALAVLHAAGEVAPATRRVLMRTDSRAGQSLPDDTDAVELPLSHEKLQALLHRMAAPHGGLWCEVPELSLSDILQMYHQVRRSTTVLLSGPIAGRIWLEGGEIVDAEANGERGMRALSLLLEAESGLLRTEPPRGPIRPTISAPFQSVVLEAARQLDERRRDSLSGGESSRVHPGSDHASTVHSGGGSRQPDSASARSPDDEASHERPSLAGAVVRPAMTPSIESPALNPESFFMPERRSRRRSWATLLGVLLGLAFAGAAASFIGTRAASAPNDAEHDTREIAAIAPSAGVLPTPRVQAPTPAQAQAPAPPPSEASSIRPEVVAPERTAGASPGPPAPEAPRAAPPPDSSLEARITSRPRSPRREAVASPDAGSLEPEIELADPGGSRADKPKAGRKDWGIRLRR